MKKIGSLNAGRKKKKRLVIIGENAAALHAQGGGSAEVRALYEISLSWGLKWRLVVTLGWIMNRSGTRGN